jgi:pyrimidine-nucleoside phosphorylase
MDVRDILSTKRDGGALSAEQIHTFIDGYVAGEIEEFHASVLLTGIFIHGMEREELATWTEAMMNSGRVMRFEGLGRPTSDKHSTGGVGDKASIPLAPAVAACGVSVPMISGRGLGHTGGTLDKLESIPGFRTDLDEAQFERALREVGLAFGAQTADLVPADRKLYALRDATGLVPSLPLISSSIMSKKLAEGAESLVLDVKYGSGAFLGDPEKGEALARTMIELAGRLGVPTRVLQTAMDRPLGRTVGHTNEILESVDCLQGGGPADLRELVCALGGEMLHLAGVARDVQTGEQRIARSLDDGSALEVFERVCEQQGAKRSVYFDERGDPALLQRQPWPAQASGRLGFVDVREVGLAVAELGGGRVAMDDVIDVGVGIEWHVLAGEEVAAGQPLCTVSHRAGRGLQQALRRLEAAVEVVDEPTVGPLIRKRL